MRIWTTLALLAAIVAGLGALSATAFARTCTTSCYGNSCTTTCF
jgi:hypothetical protein